MLVALPSLMTLGPLLILKLGLRLIGSFGFMYLTVKFWVGGLIGDPLVQVFYFGQGNQNNHVASHWSIRPGFWYSGCWVDRRVTGLSIQCGGSMCAQSCLTFCSLMDCSLPNSSVHDPDKNTGVDCPFLLQWKWAFVYFPPLICALSLLVQRSSVKTHLVVCQGWERARALALVEYGRQLTAL